MAEVIFKSCVEDMHLPITVKSAGLAALQGFPMDPLACEVLTERGFSYPIHQAKQITPELLIEADLILVMEQVHRKEIEYALPAVCGRVQLLGRWGGFAIPDPYRQSKRIFIQTYHLILQGVNEWIARLWI